MCQNTGEKLKFTMVNTSRLALFFGQLVHCHTQVTHCKVYTLKYHELSERSAATLGVLVSGRLMELGCSIEVGHKSA